MFDTFAKSQTVALFGRAAQTMATPDSYRAGRQYNFTQLLIKATDTLDQAIIPKHEWPWFSWET
jgi:hypothetical protein